MNLPPSFKHQIENECWPESSGGGLQCMCAADFCNEGVNKKLRFPGTFFLIFSLTLI